jgi:hypothetical protein
MLARQHNLMMAWHHDLPLLQLAERQAGNKAYEQHHYDTALHHYTRALAIVNFVVGASSNDQAEIQHNKAAVLLNMAAAHMAQQVCGMLHSPDWAEMVLNSGCVVARTPEDDCIQLTQVISLPLSLLAIVSTLLLMSNTVRAPSTLLASSTFMWVAANSQVSAGLEDVVLPATVSYVSWFAGLGGCSRVL